MAYTKTGNWNLVWDATQNKYILNITIEYHYAAILTNGDPDIQQFLKDNPGIVAEIISHEQEGHGGQLTEALNNTQTTYTYDGKTYTGTPDQILTQIRQDKGAGVVTQDLVQSVINNATNLDQIYGQPVDTPSQMRSRVEEDANKRSVKAMKARSLSGQTKFYNDGGLKINEQGLESLYFQNSCTPATSVVDQTIEQNRQAIINGTGGLTWIFEFRESQSHETK